MSFSRREMLLAGLGLFVSGCAQRMSGGLAQRPRMAWPESVSRPSAGGQPIEVAPPTAAAAAPAPAPPPAAAAPAAPGLTAISREHWASTGPILSRINPMNGVTRVTAHHEGANVIYFTDWATTAKRIEEVRRYHVNDRGWGDIGYHYVIDRAGRIWQARPVRYQGAHVKDHNEHNVGVMCLGNFDKQRPSQAQLTTLRSTLRTLRHHYAVATHRIYTHQELMPTRCPGASLQPRVAFLRSNGYLA